MQDFSMHHSTDSVLEVFRALNDSRAQWLLLRNTENMLPDRLELGKDIDVLIKRTDFLSFKNFLINRNFTSQNSQLANHVSWYGVTKPLVFLSPQGVALELACEIFVKSTHRGILIPLDKTIQQSAWDNKVIIEIGDIPIPMLCDEDLLVSLISRCIFDKRTFTPWQRQKITSLIQQLDRKSIDRKLSLVFFKFTPRLLELIDQADFDSILKSYITFKDY